MKRSIVYLLLVSAFLFALWRPALSGEQPSGERPAVGAVNGLAVKLYGKLAKPGENICFSPYSVSVAFAMTYAGAAGETAAEFEGAFGFGEGIHRSNALLTRNILSAPEDAAKLVVANSIWPQSGYKLLEPFTRTLGEFYDSQVTPQDYKNGAEAARNTINRWAEERTNGRIRDLLASGTVGADTRMVLVNALYFRASWLSAFSKGATEEAEFYADSGDVSTAQMMKNAGVYAYMENESFQAVKIPYSRGAFSMTLILPRERDGIGAVEENLGSVLDAVSAGGFGRGAVELYVPRFKVESEFGLNEAVASLGAGRAFIPGAADFSMMNGRDDLFISAAVHRAFIEVDEDGTEAAASTAVAVSRTSAMLNESEPVIFRADHPFIFTVQDEVSGAVIFIGRVARP
jgi:serpin B